MSERVDPETLLCKAHDARGCPACMVADFYDWIAEQKAKRAKKQPPPVDEKFDLGGES